MIEIHGVKVLENPCNFLQPFQFKITFTVDEHFENSDYEWKIVYVGSALSKDFDQILLLESMAPYTKGRHDLVLCSSPVDPEKIPKEELVAPSIVFLLGYCNKKQFFQIGYVVAKEYLDDEEPDIITQYDKLQRIIIEDHPRIISGDSDKGGELVESVMGSIENVLEKINKTILQSK